MKNVGIVFVSHSNQLANGLAELLSEVARDISLTFVGGTADGEIGTSFEQVSTIVENNPADYLLAFYDLGSARMNLEMVSDFTEKEMMIQQVPIVEGTYTAAALLQAGADLQTIQEQLAELQIKK